MILRFTLFCSFGSLQTSILCILRELEGGGSVAVAVSVSDRWKVKGERWHTKQYMWHVTHYTWDVTRDTCHMTFFFLPPVRLFLSVLVWVLVFANVKRLSVSRMRDSITCCDWQTCYKLHKLTRLPELEGEVGDNDVHGHLEELKAGDHHGNNPGNLETGDYHHYHHHSQYHDHHHHHQHHHHYQFYWIEPGTIKKSSFRKACGVNVRKIKKQNFKKYLLILLVWHMMIQNGQ